MSHDDLGCDGDHSGPVCADPECWLLPPVDLLTPSAPERIWLCISDDEDHYAEPFPDGDLEGITWCDQKPCACTVEYVRADIAERAEAERDALRALLWEARAVVLPAWASPSPKPAHLAITPERQALADRIDAALAAGGKT